MVSGTENGDRSLALVGKKGGRNFETHNSTVPFFPMSIVYIAHVAPTDRPHDVSDLPDAVGRHEQLHMIRLQYIRVDPLGPLPRPARTTSQARDRAFAPLGVKTASTAATMKSAGTSPMRWP